LPTIVRQAESVAIQMTTGAPSTSACTRAACSRARVSLSRKASADAAATFAVSSATDARSCSR
jgi:hypothetical protein